MDIGVDFGGAARARASNNWETPMHLSLFTTFCSPNILVCQPNTCDKSTPVIMGALQCPRNEVFVIYCGPLEVVWFGPGDLTSSDSGWVRRPQKMHCIIDYSPQHEILPRHLSNHLGGMQLKIFSTRARSLSMCTLVLSSVLVKLR